MSQKQIQSLRDGNFNFKDQLNSVSVLCILSNLKFCAFERLEICFKYFCYVCLSSFSDLFLKFMLSFVGTVVR